MNNIISITKQYLPDLSDASCARLEVIADRLVEMNQHLNLTALTADEEVALLHFYDSLTLLTTGLFEGEQNVLDVGCGGGFPSLPLAACTDCRVTSNDATAKKLKFVEDTARAAGIGTLTTLCGRAEELGRSADYREQFDRVVSRGVARMNILCEWCMPFVKVGGYFVAMKGNRGREELEEAQTAVAKLGGEIVSVIDAPIPVFDRSHTLLVIKKVAPTDELYPRPNGRIMKKPL
ncbi:MAG: 16S rRNA (guanine(527)-N(7))-methyltransferase RsmG [Clostridia bacterium]|nr:16S rRNA (guanine(527)-N(7))-methyltransferase RsmG [Clostridia bacterium]